MRLDFDKLIADYDKMMFETLRGFSVGVEFLETWVPSDDATESVEQLIELAGDSGLDSVELAFAPDTFRSLDLTRLEAFAARYQQIETSQAAGQASVVVHFASSDRELDGVNPLYRAALRSSLGNLHYQGGLTDAPADTLTLSTTEKQLGATLQASVEATSGKILAIRHQGAPTAAFAALLDRLCSLAVGHPVQDLADHGVSALEYELRDSKMPTGVTGIVIPERMDTLFGAATSLARALAQDFRSKAGVTSIENFYDRQPNQLWLAATPEARAALVAKKVAQFCEEVGIGAEEMTVLDVHTDTRVVVDLAPTVERARRPAVIRAAERVIQREIDPRLEMFMTERKDESILRRLSVPERK